MLADHQAYVRLGDLLSPVLDHDSFFGVPLCAGDPALEIVDQVLDGMIYRQRAHASEGTELRINTNKALSWIAEGLKKHEKEEQVAFMLRLKPRAIDQTMLEEVVKDLQGEAFESPDRFKKLCMVGGRGCLAATW